MDKRLKIAVMLFALVVAMGLVSGCLGLPGDPIQGKAISAVGKKWAEKFNSEWRFYSKN
jgi:hypothetical protein